MVKTCSICSVEQDIDNYHKDRSKKDGHDNRCKSCRSYISKTSESLKSYRKRYYKNNKEEILAKQKENPVSKEKRREYRQNAKDKLKRLTPDT